MCRFVERDREPEGEAAERGQRSQKEKRKRTDMKENKTNKGIQYGIRSRHKQQAIPTFPPNSTLFALLLSLAVYFRSPQPLILSHSDAQFDFDKALGSHLFLPLH
jgi:hypothetical protein